MTSRRFLEAQMRTLPLVLLFLIIMLFGLKYLYPWTHPDLVANNDVLRHKHPYLNTPFFIARIAVYFAIWLFWGLRLNRMADQQDRTGDPTLVERMRAFSAPGLLIFSVTGTLPILTGCFQQIHNFFRPSMAR